MKRLTWSQLSTLAYSHKVKSENLLEKAVQVLMQDKGFGDVTASQFSACFAGGNETVINFCREGEFADLDIKEAAAMTKDEIICRLSRFLSESSKECIYEDCCGMEGES